MSEFPEPVEEEPPRKSRKGLYVTLGIAGVACLLAVLCCAGVVLFATSGLVRTDEPNGGYALNAPARDGRFEFVVSKVDCGIPQIGQDFVIKKAQGQFCVVTLSVRNIGDTPQTFSVVNQHGWGPKGVYYDSDEVATAFANVEQSLWMSRVNPGNSISGVIVFDIPTDAALQKLDLHDAPSSGGVTIKVV
ncbi:DUF4352 domain-containing protein [Longispora sp. NPDC051575]|uniref:DUF4352 domain-containing protein n=1 Tax=Longispora sp. NPDC051575 TaxID=3154943 RepID=UPI00344070D7